MTALRASAEFRLQIVLEVGTAADESDPRDRAASTGATAANASCLPRLVEAARSLLRNLSEDLEFRMVTLTGPSGVRVIAQGAASPEELARIRTRATAVDYESSLRPACDSRNA